MCVPSVRRAPAAPRPRAPVPQRPAPAAVAQRPSWQGRRRTSVAQQPAPVQPSSPLSAADASVRIRRPLHPGLVCSVLNGAGRRWRAGQVQGAPGLPTPADALRGFRIPGSLHSGPRRPRAYHAGRLRGRATLTDASCHQSHSDHLNPVRGIADCAQRGCRVHRPYYVLRCS